jgi:hypothetical protein
MTKNKKPRVIENSRVSRLKDDAHSPEVQKRLMRQFSEARAGSG